MPENENLQKVIDRLSQNITRDIERDIINRLSRCGLYFRVFSRVKSGCSVVSKLESKKYADHSGKKLQDLIGLRITLYYSDDIELCEQVIKDNYHVDNVSRSTQEINEFGPCRLNYVCKIPDTLNLVDKSIYTNFSIDNTMEIQIRTIFSEGWHEIEHDMRYKCIHEWDDNTDLSHMLNGIYANLTMCDWSIRTLFETLSYRNYKNQEWERMLKNRIRIKMTNYSLDEYLTTILNTRNDVAKGFLRLDRVSVLIALSRTNVSIPLTLMNIVYIANELHKICDDISSRCPDVIKVEMRRLFETETQSDS